MWDSIKEILTSNNGIAIVILLLVLIFVVLSFVVVLIKTGFLKIYTKHVKLGNKISERELIRRQIEKAHEFVMGIEGKIYTDTTKYNGYFTKYILERIYDKVIEWIMFNHITVNQIYIQDKQETILNLIYALPINEEFKTPQFKEQVEKWVKELIEQLVNVKSLYGNNME